jgi:hypothetical protein
MARTYYKQRTSGLSGPKLSINETGKLAAGVFRDLEQRALFEEVFGKSCPDGSSDGTAGSDPGGYIQRTCWVENAWPMREALQNADEGGLFTLIEFLFDHASKGLTGRMHGYANCGVHYDTFDRDAGAAVWREEINKILPHYGEGFEMNERGEVQRFGAAGLRGLWNAPLPASADPERVAQKVEVALAKFRRGLATKKERQEAVRELADVLEFMRKGAKAHLAHKDESDLFNIANNFAIRHNNDLQKTQYDALWLSWVFHVYLATIHMLVRLEDRARKGVVPPPARAALATAPPRAKR